MLSAETPAQITSQTRGRLLRILGVGFGLAISIGNTIAAGIVRTPGEIAQEISSVWLFLGIWLMGGVYALLGANCIAELGAALPRSGAQYVFSHRALGPYPGFIVGWSDWLSTCGTAAAVAFVIGEYTETLLPALAGQTVTVALTVVLFFAVLQWRGLRWGSTTQNLTSLAKCLAFIVLVGACFVLGGDAAESGPAAAPADSGSSTALFFALVLALQSVIFTYDGWAGPVYFSEEIEHTDRNLPRALFGGVLAVLAIYLLWNVALLYVLPLERIAGDKFAMGTAANRIFGAHGDSIVRALMILSMLAGINAYHLMATRVVFGMSRDGLFWKQAARVNAGGTPSVSLWISVAIAALFIVLSGTFKTLIDALSFFFVANYTLSFTSLFVLRRREPHLPRPFRAWGHPWTTGLALLSSIAFLAGAIVGDLRGGTRSSIYALAILVASYPAYRLMRRMSPG